MRAVQAKDTRFDGTFITAVTTTGIYCRPSCPAMTPRPEHMRFYPSAAAAQRDGYRACKRCRPDASPGSPEWDVRGDAVGRAMRLIGDGVVDRDGVPGLADRLGWSVRQVQRMLQAELGAGPLALARAQRAQTARVLLETTDLPVTDVALTAGFGSLRAFNETVQQVFAATPTQLRATARRSAGTHTRNSVGSGVTVSNPRSLGGHDVACSTPRGGGAHSGLVALDLRLPFRPPLHPDTVFGHLAATAVPGVEEWRDGAYRRILRLPHAWGVASLRPPAPGSRHVDCRLLLADLRDLTAATARVRWLLDLDADPVAVDAALGEDPALAPFVDARPGIRVPRSVDGPELAIRAVLGQQVSTAAARTHAARLVLAHGTAITDPEGGLTHLFPDPAALLELDPDALALPTARRTTLLGLVAALASGRLDLSPGCDREEARVRLTELRGLGPWTVDVVAMRALGDPDVLLSTDLGVRQAASRLGLGSGRALMDRSAQWRPWRSYATQLLWATGDHPINRLPAPPSCVEQAPRADPPPLRVEQATSCPPSDRRLQRVTDEDTSQTENVRTA